jgi:Icc-related predicted phosphoesterase
MVITIIADLHGNLIDIKPCDLLLIAGDICPATNHDREFQRHWLNIYFKDWLNKIPAKEVVGIAGNHDLLFEDHPDEVPKDLRWHYLQDNGIEIMGLKLYGVPWTIFFYDWSFNAPQFDIDEKFLHEKFNQVPEGTDILITHGPPFGIADEITMGRYKGRKKLGSVALRERIEIIKPKIVCCGHIHSSSSINDFRGTQIINASILDENYQVAYEPKIIEI